MDLLQIDIASKKPPPMPHPLSHRIGVTQDRLLLLTALCPGPCPEEVLGPSAQVFSG